LDHVTIALADGIAESMKVRRRFDNLEDEQVLGQLGVECLSERWAVELRLGLKADDLAERVHARVGPAAGDALAPHPGDPLNGCFESPLHRARLRLPLPAGEVGAVVGEREFEGGHSTYATFPVPRPSVPSGKTYAYRIRSSICPSLIALLRRRPSY